MIDTQWWAQGLADVCTHFQVDLSCLVDGELDEGAAGRAVAHLEGCEACREFFDDTRMQVRLHLDMADPDRLLRRFSNLTGLDPGGDTETLELVERLKSIFYQLGKAYVLASIDPGWRTRVFEPAVAVDSARSRGRGFIDGVLSRGAREADGVDWSAARKMLNGQLARIEGGLEKGLRLLHEALAIDPDHEESLLYLAFVHAHQDRRLVAERAFRRIFDTALGEVNRGHAAVQLALLHEREGDWKRAIAYLRWVTMSRLEEVEERFWVVHFNIGMYHAFAGQDRRALEAFRRLLDRHPDRAAEVASFFARSAKLRKLIDSRPGLGRALLELCPELFRTPDPTEDGVRDSRGPHAAGENS